MRKLSNNAIAVLKKRETETWIYSYADLITNLLALFVMLLIIMTGSQKNRDDFKKGIERFTKGKEAVSGYAGTGALKIDDLRQLISDYINRLGLAGRVGLERTKTGVELTFESALLFQSGTAVISDEAQEIMGHVAGILTELPPKFVIDVEGHADNRPISSGRYPSNWELSSARAGSVVRFLETKGIQSKKMRAIGFGSTRPIDGTGDAEANRRVVVRINAEDGGTW
jgi:chemotaxis protein MotB